ncbi:hypothetical protein ALC53_12951 [Atta colombica]|uniref:Uncharacterized protein n=1 Tax=Atta colombica TaxID=520822 RepID=A0A195AX21_9HYME|nr:hypothetical protein ALC53_12951 [Atta colombica]
MLVLSSKAGPDNSGSITKFNISVVIAVRAHSGDGNAAQFARISPVLIFRLTTREHATPRAMFLGDEVTPTFSRLYCYPPLVETIRSLNPSVRGSGDVLFFCRSVFGNATDLTFLCTLVGPSHSSSVAKNRASLRSTVLSDPTSLRKLLSQGFLHPPLTKPRT